MEDIGGVKESRCGGRLGGGEDEGVEEVDR